MAVFEPNRPVVTTEPFVVVDAGLPAGPHHFRLVVFDDGGRPSAPDEVVVTVSRRAIPAPDPGPTSASGPIG